jgi:hypothetical protein
MTATNAEYSNYLNCEVPVLIHHLGCLYGRSDILYEQFALALAYSNQSSVGLLSNTVLMMSSIFYARCSVVQTSVISPPLVRPFNILLKLKNTHYYQEKTLCTYEFRHIGSRFCGLESEYTRLKRSIDDSEKITMKLTGYRVAFKRLEFYIALSRWHIINEYQNSDISHIFAVNNDVIIVEGHVPELDDYLRLWESAMKTWATELFSDHNFDNIMTKWRCEFSLNMESVVLFLLAGTKSRAETVIEPVAPQVLHQCHGINVNSNNNSDEQSKIQGNDAEDDDGDDLIGRNEFKRNSSRPKRKRQDVDGGDLFCKKKSKRQSSRLKSKGQDEGEDDARDSCGKMKNNRHSSRLKKKRSDEDEARDFCSSYTNKRQNTTPSTTLNNIGNGAKAVEAGANKDKDVVEFDVIEDLKQLRNKGLSVAGFTDLSSQKFRCLMKELTKSLKTLSRQNTVTNSTLMNHIGLIEGFDIRLRKYLKGKQWTTSIKDTSTAELVESHDTGKELKVQLITLEEKVSSKRKLGNVMVVNGPILDSKMLGELVDAINRSPMCKSTDVLGGSKKDTYLGYFSQRNPTQYGYRDGTISIQAMPIKGAMTPLLDIVQNHLLKILYDHMGKKKMPP